MHGALQVILLGVVVVATLWCVGVVPTSGIVKTYKRIRLTALLWVLAIAAIAVVRVFDIP